MAVHYRLYRVSRGAAVSIFVNELTALNNAIHDKHVYILARLDWLSDVAITAKPNYAIANMRKVENLRLTKTIAHANLVEQVEAKLKEVIGEKFPVAGDLWSKAWWKFLKGDGSDELREEYFWVFTHAYPSFQRAKVQDWKHADLKNLLRALFLGEVALKKMVWIPGPESWPRSMS